VSSSSEARQPYFAGTKLQALGFASQTFAGFAFIERFKLLNSVNHEMLVVDCQIHNVPLDLATPHLRFGAGVQRSKPVIY
jgi:hypothetical protein